MDRSRGQSHPHHLDEYVGEFEHPAYGVLTISKKDESLMFDFHKIRMPLGHFHYDRFDTADDEQDGKWSVNFLTNAQGEIDRAEMSLDQSAVTLTRRVPAALSNVTTLRQYLGTYETASGGKFNVVLRPDNTLAIQYPDGTFQNLLPWQPHRFRVKEFADVTYEFARCEWTRSGAQADQSFGRVHVHAEVNPGSKVPRFQGSKVRTTGGLVLQD